ncbi:E3 ubiquitin-protein ligase rad18 [Bachmanniomyces sp. S44760]|nr:E3 ubiquitin-protein ligase rad18 [Bachmanniomyces sp. S44760]
MRVEDVFLHLDKHQDRPTKPSDPSRKIPSNTKAFAKTPERLPQLSYSILKETALRKKLSELGIPNWGPRPLLIRRHTEWINLWNANCDSSSPRRKRELLRDLDVWERTQGGHATTSTGTVGGGKSVMDKEFDGTAWAASHDDDFQQLIARARRKPPAPVAPESEPVGHAPDESFEDDSSKMKLDEASDGGTPNPNADVSLTMPFGDASVLKNFDEDLQSGSSTDCMIVLSR